MMYSLKTQVPNHYLGRSAPQAYNWCLVQEFNVTCNNKEATLLTKIPIMVTYMKLLNENPDELNVRFESLEASWQSATLLLSFPGTAAVFLRLQGPGMNLRALNLNTNPQPENPSLKCYKH